MSPADGLREFALERYVNPARAAGHREIVIRAGDLHNAMGLSNRVPAVCGALGTNVFLDMADLRLLARGGPGQGMNATFRFEIVYRQGHPPAAVPA